MRYVSNYDGNICPGLRLCVSPGLPGSAGGTVGAALRNLQIRRGGSAFAALATTSWAPETSPLAVYEGGETSSTQDSTYYHAVSPRCDVVLATVTRHDYHTAAIHFASGCSTCAKQLSACIRLNLHLTESACFLLGASRREPRTRAWPSSRPWTVHRQCWHFEGAARDRA